MGIVAAGMHDFWHGAAVLALLLVLDPQSINIPSQGNPLRGTLIATFNDNAAPFGSHPNAEAKPIEQLVQMQAGAELRTARFWIGVHSAPQLNHPAEGFVDRRISSTSPI
jgi:hypothetical protein